MNRLNQTGGRHVAKTFWVAIVGLALLCTSPAMAGSSGNGWAPVSKTHYSFCFGGLQKTIYFSNVIVSAPAANRPELNGPFGNYLTKTFGANSNDGGQCITSEVMADTANAKKQREAAFIARKWKIVEINWAGAGSL
jgi:Na+/citrate or Na+/malate symporter